MRMSFNPQNYQFSAGKYNNSNVIFVHFPFDMVLKKELREKLRLNSATIIHCFITFSLDAMTRTIAD